LSDEVGARREIDELIRLLSTVEIEEFGDVIGYVYEDLIPAGERHQMGEFYTPPPIAGSRLETSTPQLLDSSTL
jgi:type I restriction-modification system DNA methylase subunit